MKLLPIFLILVSCASNDIPGAVCAEYGGIRRISKNFVFCNNSTVYDRNERHYLNRTEDLDIPTVEEQHP